jgi:glutamyl-tRNA reductase
MAVAVFGLNHACVDLEKLEQISFNSQDVIISLKQVSRTCEIRECVILSTCNRIEFYAIVQENGIGRQILYDFVKHAKPSGMDETGECFYYKEGSQAIEHLFAVASGLDSLVVGENEIGGQVKKAYRLACEQKTTGVMMNKLFHAAFRTSKRVKNETRINEGNCSVGCVAVDIAEATFPDLQQCRALVIGAGDIGKVVAKTLANRQVKQLVIANRSIAKAVDIANEVGGTAIPLHEIHDYLEQVDIIVSGTDSPDYLLKYADVAELPQCPSSQLLLIDMALPRDFEPTIGNLTHVILKNLYDLKEIVDSNIKKREQEIPKVTAIIDEELKKFLYWKDSLKINSTIKTLNVNFETIRLRELDRYRHQFPEEIQSQVDIFTKSLTKKYLHLIISNLKSLYDVCELDERQMHILQHLFDSHGADDEQTDCRNKRQQPGPEADPDSCRPAENSLSHAGN